MRSGVRTKLVLAISLVAAMTVLSGIVSWFYYTAIESLLITVLQDQTPTISSSLKLAEASSRFATATLAFNTTRNQLQRQSVAVALDQQIAHLDEILATLRRTSIDKTRLDLIQGLVGTLERNLEQQNQLVSTRLDLQTRIRRVLADLRASHLVFLAALRAAMPESSGTEADRVRRLWDMESTADRMVRTWYEADKLERLEALVGARSTFEADRSHLAGLVAALPGNGAEAAQLRRAAQVLAQPGAWAGEGFEHLEELLRTLATLRTLDSDNGNTVSRLSIAVVQLVDDVQATAEATGQQAGEQIAAGRYSMLAIAVATFLGPMVFVWLLLGRTIVVPLTDLAAATRRIAAGELTTPIPNSGQGEIAELADALVVFRDNTAALAERSGALHASEARQRQAREEAERALEELKRTQEQLVQSEKMAALGGLVAGVAHEINTPIGIVLTSITFLAAESEAIRARFTSNALRRSDFEAFFAKLDESTRLSISNIQRASDLIQSFKNVAVDQVNEESRHFNFRSYLQEVLTSLTPTWRKAGLKVALDCPEALEIDGVPGIWFCIVSNFVTNSVVHAFDKGQEGLLTVAVREADGDTVELSYTDDGRGIPTAHLSRVFEPFFTTGRANGSTGLGMHIVYNLVSGRMGGTIRLDSAPGRGVRFTIRFPRSLPPAPESDAAQVVVGQG
jgi:signal transduction histidine kinase